MPAAREDRPLRIAKKLSFLRFIAGLDAELKLIQFI
jgi:hypothetical protein